MAEFHFTRREVPDVALLLSELALFQALPDSQRASLAAATRVLHAVRGQILFRKGDECHGLFVVVRGQIKLGVGTPGRHEKVLEVIGPGQSFGEAVMFMNRPYPVFAEALLDTTLLHVSKEAVLEAIENATGFARAMLAGLSQRLHMLISDLESYSIRSGTQRVIGYLLQQCEANAPTESNVSLTVPVSKQVLASRLNLTPESLSRVLRDLSVSNLISVHGNQVTIIRLEDLREFDLPPRRRWKLARRLDGGPA